MVHSPASQPGGWHSLQVGRAGLQRYGDCVAVAQNLDGADSLGVTCQRSRARTAATWRRTPAGDRGPAGSSTTKAVGPMVAFSHPTALPG